MLGFTEFKNEFVTRCSERLAACTGACAGSGVKIEEQRITKAQLGELTGLIFRAGASSCAPTLYAEDFYRMYRDGHSLDELSIAAAGNISRYLREAPDLSENAFEDTANLRIRLLNRSRNSGFLNKVPYMDTGCGLVLVAEVVSGEYRAVVTESLLDSIGISRDELFDTAVSNSVEKDPPVLFELSELLSLGHDICANLLDKAPGTILPAPDSLYLLSNKDSFRGAAALFYPGVAEKICELMGGTFYVLPSSVHEVLILPFSEGDPQKLADIICSANKTVVDKSDFLSDDLYLCKEGVVSRINCSITSAVTGTLPC